jgi:hypothetical protein
MVLTVYFVLSPVTGLFATVVRRSLDELDASVGASGPHDFAVRNQHRSSFEAAASTASRPAFVTIAKRPSCRDGMERVCRDDLPDRQSGMFFT